MSQYLLPFSQHIAQKTGVLSLEEGENAIIARGWLTSRAEKSIDIQYFIFSADNVGKIASDYLVRAAERGVKVRVLVDDLMVEADADILLALDSHPNLDIKIYNPNINIGKTLSKKVIHALANLRAVNQRMHNKTFIVDGKVVITGGRNIADEYFDYSQKYNFRDRDVLLLGKVVAPIQKSFETYWNHPLSKAVGDIAVTSFNAKQVADVFKYIRDWACDSANYWPQMRHKIRTIHDSFKRLVAAGELEWLNGVAYISDVPGKNDRRRGLKGGGISTDTLISLIKRARKKIYIQSPYLITTKLGRKLLKAACDRGVDVRILTNSLASTDNLPAFSGYQRVRKMLLKFGVRIYEYRPDAAIRRKIMNSDLQRKLDFAPIFSLHAKTLVVDDSITVIGTFNMDPRSANLNTECLTIIPSFSFTQRIVKRMNEEMQPGNAWPVTLKHNPDKYSGTGKRIRSFTRRLIPKKLL